VSKIYVVVKTADRVQGCNIVVAMCSGGDHTRKLYLESHLQDIYKADRSIEYCITRRYI
jgi:hypothetical protein